MTPDGKDCKRILIVDDEPQVVRVLSRVLARAGYDYTTAGSAAEARQLFRREAFDILLADVNMPEESGLKLAQHILVEFPDTPVIMVTALDDPDIANVALQHGAYGYVIKPFTPNEVQIAVANALRRGALEAENRSHREGLEKIIRARTAALERSAHQLTLTREETVRRLCRAVEYRDEVTPGHIDRMSRYAALLARRLGLDSESIRLASPMHDVGKVAIPDGILLKAETLTPAERSEMERHTEIGREILSGSGSALIELGATIAWTHHERFDGTGYPRGLEGDEIPIEGQVAALADVFDSLTCERPYRAALSLEDAVEAMRAERGRHFAPHLLDLFLDPIDELMSINRLHREAAGLCSTGSPATSPSS
jgi:putative two-component system response regulator